MTDGRRVLFDLHGKVALVTGAGRGVGAGIARMLAGQGAAVAVNDLDPERAEATAAALRADGASAVAVPFDVTDHAAVAAGVAAVGRDLGPIGILVCNAGNAGATPMRVKPFLDTTPDEWDAPLRVNIHGVLNSVHAVAPGMRERGWGRIVTISSTAGTVGAGIGVATYSTGKGGGIAFTRTLAIELAGSGVTANTLAIGLQEQENPTVTRALAATIPVGRAGRPEDVGAACVWLVSDEASWVTGQTIEINGGQATT